MWFRIASAIEDVEAIAIGASIRELKRLRKAYGGRRWRKLKGTARVQLPDGSVLRRRYIGTRHMESERREMKVKRFLE